MAISFLFAGSCALEYMHSMSVIHAVVQVNVLLALMIFEVLGQSMLFGDFNAPDRFQPIES